MNAVSSDDDKDGLISEWGGESRQDWRGWRNESESWLRRRVDAHLSRPPTINDEMVGGWAKNGDEERVVRGG